MSRLEDILADNKTDKILFPEAKQAIKDLFLELIGKDDKPNVDNAYEGRNRLREYLRKNVSEL